MKKILLSAAVIVAFLFYSYHERTESEEARVIIPPTTTPTTSAGSETINTIPTTTIIPTSQTVSAKYKDGSYTGNAADAFYGNIQVQAIINGGKITDIKFLQYPNDRGTSIEINTQSNPILAQEAIQKQDANVDIVSGATDSSEAFIQSLKSALNKAKI